mgnify:CR=1 FL=1
MNLKYFVYTILVFVLVKPTVSQTNNSPTEKAPEEFVSLVYHRFGDDRYPSTNISMEDFISHLQYLKSNEYNVITLGEAVDMLQSLEGIPDKTVVITIDDGYRSFLENAMPQLRKFDFSATLFISTKYAGNEGYLTWGEITNLRKEGIEIGNHSHTHEYFVNEEDPDKLLKNFRNDLIRSQNLFKEHLGFEPDLYSYPFGEFTGTMKEELQRQGFVASAAQNSGVVSNYSDLYALPRFPMNESYGGKEQFTEKINMKPLPVEVLLPETPLINDTIQPVLKVKLIRPDLIISENISCYVEGSEQCNLQYDDEDQVITVQSAKPVDSRRTLFTITAPSAIQPSRWCWFSYVFIHPAIKN